MSQESTLRMKVKYEEMLPHEFNEALRRFPVA